MKNYTQTLKSTGYSWNNRLWNLDALRTAAPADAIIRVTYVFADKGNHHVDLKQEKLVLAEIK